MQAASQVIRLNSGRQIPMLGLGTFLSETGGECRDSVKAAILSGYRHIDGAGFYGNEREVGEGISLALKESKGQIKREDLFLTSKLWATKMNPEDVESTLRASLRDLGTDYVDLYLIHWPHALVRNEGNLPKHADGKPKYDESVSPSMTWAALEKMVEKGLAKNIGVSNFNSRQVQDILDICKIKPVMNQVELHPYLQQEKLRQFCSDRGILLTAYSPLGRPGFSAWNRLNVLKEPALEELAKKHGKGVAQIIFRWMFQRGIITVPKSSNPKRLAQNIDIFSFKLSDQDMDAIAKLDMGKAGRLLWGYPEEDENATHKHYPFGIEF